jgi:hypothetical protein
MSYPPRSTMKLLGIVLLMLFTNSFAVAEPAGGYAILEARPSLIFDVLNTRCPIVVSSELTINEVIGMKVVPEGFAVDCLTSIPAGKKTQRLAFTISEGRLLIAGVEAANISALTTNVGGESRSFLTRVVPGAHSFRFLVAPQALPELDMSTIPGLLTDSEVLAPSGFAIAITPQFSQVVSSIANGAEIRDPAATVTLKSITLSLTEDLKTFAFVIDAGPSVKSGLIVDAVLTRGESNTTLLQKLALRITPPTGELTFQERLADQAAVTAAKVIIKRVSDRSTGKPFIVPGRQHSLGCTIGSVEGVFEITARKSRILTVGDGMPDAAFVFDGYLRFKRN